MKQSRLFKMQQNSFFKSLIYSAVFLILGISSSSKSVAANLSSLHNFFDNTTVAGTIDAEEYSESTYFGIPKTGFLDLNVSLMLERAGYAKKNGFGLYDAAGETFISLFDGAATAGDQASVRITSDSQLLFGDLSFTLEGPVSFYLERDGKRFFANDSNNGVPQSLVYTGQGQQLSFSGVENDFLSSDRIIAFEDTWNGDKDYNDMMVFVESILQQPILTSPNDLKLSNAEGIPEPSFLSGLGIITLLGIAYKRKNWRKIK
ncbi:MAG: PEP-CTERM sorting domain-containing protein [Cyanobacteria bacterium P01_G01_bin.49]